MATKNSRLHAPNAQNCHGVIIGSNPIRDADVILKIITPQSGKKYILARGARKSFKRFGAAFDLFDIGEFTFRPSRNLDGLLILEEFTPSSTNKRSCELRESFEKICCASLICEISDKLSLEEDHTEQQMFELITEFLTQLPQTETTRELLKKSYATSVYLLAQAGYIDPSCVPEAGVKALTTVLGEIERHSGRTLRSKSAVLSLCSSL